MQDEIFLLLDQWQHLVEFQALQRWQAVMPLAINGAGGVEETHGGIWLILGVATCWVLVYGARVEDADLISG